MFSGSKKINPDNHFLFLSQVPINEPPPRSPKGPLRRALPVYKAFFNIPLKFLGDRGSTVVKVLCYKSEGRWFDRSWCQLIFL